MAKKQPKNTTGKHIDSGHDGKNRLVTLTEDNKEFIVEKLALNAPVSEKFKTEKEAKARFKELIEDTQN